MVKKKKDSKETELKEQDVKTKKISKKEIKKTKKKSKINKKNIPSLNLKDESEIAMDFAINAYKRFDKIIRSNLKILIKHI